MDENFPKLVQLCAGLPHVSDRELAETERTELLSEARRNMRRFFSLISAVVLYIGTMVFLTWNLFEISLNGPLLLPMILLLFFAVPFAVLIGCDSYDKARILQKALKDGTIHCFEGSLQSSDWTDGNIQILRETDLLLPDSDRQAVELFSAHNFVYKINGIRPKVLRKLCPTLAAMPECVAPYFALPAAWVKPEFSQAFERRRLSAEECSEIVSYAKGMRRRIILILFLTFLGCQILLTVLLPTGLPLSSCLRISVITGLVFGGLLVFRQEFKVRKVLKDAEFGWAIVHLPVKEEQGDSKKTEDNVAVEFLPASRLIWRIEEKPAGWRGQA
jgi:predicted nucleic acid-binding Zn ribbon protein